MRDHFPPSPPEIVVSGWLLVIREKNKREKRLSLMKVFACLEEFLKDFLFPRFCFGCGQRGQYFCNKCRKKIKKAILVCPECGKKSAWGRTHRHCEGRWSPGGLAALFSYQGVIRKAIKKLKYELVTDLVPELGELAMGRFGKEKKWQWDENWVMVPVPLWGRRERWRGFNQAELLGDYLAKRSGWGKGFWLRRKKKTNPQAEIKSRKVRLANVKGVFELTEEGRREVGGKRIILVDDVLTTGATAREAVKVLKKGGAELVWILVVAKG